MASSAEPRREGGIDAIGFSQVRAAFPVLKDLVYLNTASIGLIPTSVQEEADRFGREIANRGTTWFDEEQEVAALERARAAAATMLNAPRDNIAVTTSVSEALSQIAWWMRPGAGKNIVSIDLEFPSVTYPWFRLSAETGVEVRLVQASADPASLTLDSLAALMDSNTTALCVSHVQFATGHRFELADLAEIAASRDALLLIDATQSMGAVPIDLTANGVDLLLCGGYKWLCGPFGAAIAYLGPRLLEGLDPIFVGWKSTADPYSMDASTLSVVSSARALEYSTMAYSAGVTLGAAIEYVNGLGVDRINAHNLELAEQLHDGLQALGATVLTPREEARHAGIVTARFADRDGEAIAHLLNRSGVIVSPRFGSTRYAVHFFNTVEDVARALEVTEWVLDNGTPVAARGAGSSAR